MHIILAGGMIRRKNTGRKTAIMNTEVILVVRSVTHATKGRKALASLNISSRIVRPVTSEPSQKSDSGCVYGIAVNKARLIQASEILENNGIDIKEILHV